MSELENDGIPVIDEKTNPISGAKWESVDELFSKDPQFLTEENLANICQKLREGRGTWLASERTKSKASTSKAKLSPEAAKNLLDNLVIEI